MGLLALLPTVRDELVLVDHSYKSLAYAMLKYLLLQERGYKDAIRLLSSKNNDAELRAILESLKDRLPADVLKASTTRQSRYINSYSYDRETFEVSVVDDLCSNLSYDYAELRRYWESFPKSLVKRAARKLAKVRFIHGDMADLEQHGPFDLFYMSNAHEHTDRHGRSPALDNVAKILKPGGLVISTKIYGRRYRYGGLPRGWKELSTQNSHSCGYGWTYHLYQVPA